MFGLVIFGYQAAQKNMGKLTAGVNMSIWPTFDEHLFNIYFNIV